MQAIRTETCSVYNEIVQMSIVQQLKSQVPADENREYCCSQNAYGMLKILKMMSNDKVAIVENILIITGCNMIQNKVIKIP